MTALALVVLVARSGTDKQAVRAIALAELAAVLGLLATRGWLRRAVTVCVGLLGLLLLGSDQAVAVVAGALLAGVGAVGTWVAGGWPTMGRRYDAPGESRPGPAADLWSRIDAGDDPTA